MRAQPLLSAALLLAACLSASAQDEPSPPTDPPPGEPAPPSEPAPPVDPPPPPPPPPTPIEIVRAKIAALELDAAKDALAPIKAEAKSPAEKEEVKALEKEITVGRQVETAAKKIAKLVDDRKPREAYALVLAAGDQLAGALALRGLKERARDAQTLAYQVICDFDALPEAVGAAFAPEAGRTFLRTRTFLLTDSRAHVIADPFGGKALHWIPTTTARSQRIEWILPGTIDLAHFDHVTVRLRCAKAPAATVALHLGKAGDTSSRLIHRFTLKPGNRWQEVRMPVLGLEKKGDVDPATIGFVALHYQGADDFEVDVDEVMVAKKGVR